MGGIEVSGKFGKRNRRDGRTLGRGGRGRNFLSMTIVSVVGDARGFRRDTDRANRGHLSKSDGGDDDEELQ
jgi:hypothetical protein